MSKKTGFLLVQTGSPDSPDTDDVKKYLRHFLSDPCVVDHSPLLWQPLLNLVVLPYRTPESARLYKKIWDGKQFPLPKITTDFCRLVNKVLPASKRVTQGYLCSSPTMEEAVDSLLYWGADHIVFIPAFPQYCGATTRSVFQRMNHLVSVQHPALSYSFIPSFHRENFFLEPMVSLINRQLKVMMSGEGLPDALVMSFHGVPQRWVKKGRDPYLSHCQQTFSLLKRRVELLPSSKIFISFQSKFGPEKWLEPATNSLCLDLVKKGDNRVAVICPSFVVDCLETLEEIGMSLTDRVASAGGELFLLPSLNTDDKWVDQFSGWVSTFSVGNQSV